MTRLLHALVLTMTKIMLLFTVSKWNCTLNKQGKLTKTFSNCLRVYMTLFPFQETKASLFEQKCALHVSEKVG